MNLPTVPAPPIDWIRATAAARRLGIHGRELFLAELEIGRLGIRTQRFGKREILMACSQDVEQAAQHLAQRSTAP